MLTVGRLISCNSWVRRTLFPFYHFDQLKIFGPALFVAVIAAALTRDAVLTITLVILIYLGFVVLMQRWNPYRLYLPRELTDIVTGILDETGFLERPGGGLVWRRRTPRILDSKLDVIEVNIQSDEIVIEGRKSDLEALTAAVNRRMQGPP